MLEGTRGLCAACLLLSLSAFQSALAQGGPAPVAELSSATDLSPAAELRALKERLSALEARLVSPVKPTPGAGTAAAAGALAKPEPFAFGDFTWLNGNNRQPSALLDSKYVTGGLVLDTNYTYSFNQPIDHTIVGNTITSRHNELNLTMVSAGADFHHENVRATLTLQYGSRPNLVQSSDGTTLRGQFNLAEVHKYIREVNFGYHFDVLYGLNIDVGIFMSYIGMASYLSFENWSYQAPYTADNTPWYFEGVRVQFFPTEKLKIEMWIVNGWQSYSKYGEWPGGGFQFNYRPREWLTYVSNDYFGVETRGEPGRVRFHTDNTLQLRYLDRADSRVMSRAALTATVNYGFEAGGGVNAGEQYYLSAMLYHRVWFYRNIFAWTLGGTYMTNPGRYLILVPPDPPGISEQDRFKIGPGLQFSAWELITNLDWMPNHFLTYRIEYVYRGASVPYFNGPGGITSPDGFIDTPTAGFRPDRVTDESRLILALLVRM